MRGSSLLSYKRQLFFVTVCMDPKFIEAIAALLAAAGGFVGGLLSMLGRRHAEIRRLERRLARVVKRIAALEKAAGKP